ncbi:2' O-ribose methyltransferase [Arachnomyces sp. PD_36]|nr:2' O-ribose methyltransferase [Arachnomyces sp. PD_36]
MATLCESQFCAADEYRLSLKTTQLENEYNAALHWRNSLVAQEENRLLRVKTLFLGDDKAELDGQLQRVLEQLEASQASESRLQGQLHEAENRQGGSQNTLRAKLREIDNLKFEIAALNNNSLDSSKLLAEKLALSRELSNVKAELEHLRSQSESYQTLLTSKLSLERQLSSLEVELDTTKRALERARAKDATQKEEDTSAAAKLEGLDKELAREREERERVEKEAKRRAIEWDTQRASLESQLEACRNELRQARNQSRSKRESMLRDEGETHRRDSRKRSIPRFDPDMTIGTPGDIHHHKKTKSSSALPGDKSEFSITPFLNRTSNSFDSRLDESSGSESDGGANYKKKRDSVVDVKAEESRKRKAPRQSGTKLQNAVGTAAQASSSSNLKAPPRGSSSISALEKVLEEDDDSAVSTTLNVDASKGEVPKPKSRKKKFLGASRETTLFDEDEPPDAPPKNRRTIFGNGRALGKRGGIHLTTDGNSLRGEVSTELYGQTASPTVCYRQFLRSVRLDLQTPRRYASSNKRWQARQSKDRFTREAAVQGLKSRAAFKLLQLDEKHRIFKAGQTVVDLGYAPGSWSQHLTKVAIDRTKPRGRVLGVDIIPAQPPKGMSTIQGNFLSPAVQSYVQEFLSDPARGRPRNSTIFRSENDQESELTEKELEERQRGYIDREKNASIIPGKAVDGALCAEATRDNEAEKWTVDVVLSDMSEPWEQTTGFWKRSLSNPYHRMMNTSGVSFRDHAGSIDLCRAALQFSFNTLRAGGHFVCKFYQGAEDKALENQLKQLFHKVHREKPESSRSESKEAYFIGLRRKPGATREAVLSIS